MATIKQHDHILESGQINKYCIYVQSGCLMMYYTDKSGTDHVLQFPVAGWWTGDLQSFHSAIPSRFSIKALTDCEVLMIAQENFSELLHEVPPLEKYFRIIYQNALVTQQDRLIQNFSATAEERYLAFQKTYPSLEQYVPLKYIASYLGITPEFLSKVRRHLAKG